MDKEDTLWEFEPHTTRAKHKILESYLKAWFPILASSGFNGRVVYIDGFAGPGEDSTKTKKGSPLIAIDTYLNHNLRPKFKAEIVMFFIEKKKDRAEHLKELINKLYPSIPPQLKWEIENNDFITALSNILDNLEKEGNRLAPTFCFVDPFGWEDINIELLSRFMKENKAELFITFMAGFINRFLTSNQHLNSLKKLFSEDQISEVNNISQPQERMKKILQFFVQNLKNKIFETAPNKKIYDLPFETLDKQNNTMYFLIYLTSHPKGIKVMKEAMYSVAKDGSYLFNDYYYEPGQTNLFDFSNDNLWVEKAADQIYKRFKKGYRISIKDLEDYILLNTLWLSRKNIFKLLEKNNKIKFIGNRKKKFTYPETGEVEFI